MAHGFIDLTWPDEHTLRIRYSGGAARVSRQERLGKRLASSWSSRRRWDKPNISFQWTRWTDARRR